MSDDSLPLIFAGELVGYYQAFDYLRPNLIISHTHNQDDGQVAIFFNRGLMGKIPSEKVEGITLIKTSETVKSARDGYFKKSELLESVLRRLALSHDANIVDSDFYPPQVYEAHTEAYKLGRNPVPVRQ